jgi:hypothetical protein
MSRWSHSICAKCWYKRNPDQEPHRLVNRHVEICCYCGEQHFSGIYVRDNPAELRCKGVHLPEAA